VNVFLVGNIDIGRGKRILYDQKLLLFKKLPIKASEDVIEIVRIYLAYPECHEASPIAIGLHG
jgi:hypothetical protein